MEEKDQRERAEIMQMSITEQERDKLMREHTQTMEKYVQFFKTQNVYKKA